MAASGILQENGHQGVNAMAIFTVIVTSRSAPHLNIRIHLIKVMPVLAHPRLESSQRPLVPYIIPPLVLIPNKVFRVFV